jgi:O-antigen ligase
VAGRLARPDLVAGSLLVGLALPVGLLAGVQPVLAIAFALGIVFTLVALNDLALALAIFVYVSFIGLAPFGAEDGAARLVLGLAAFALVATRRRRELELPTMHPGLSVLLLLLVGWAALSVAWAEDAGEAIPAAERIAVNAVLVMIVFAAIRTPRDLSMVLGAFVLGAVTAVLIGLVSAPGGADAGRLGTEILDPNLLAAALIAAAAICVALYALDRDPLIRLLTICAAMLCAVGVLLTASRGALIAITFCLVAAVLLAGRWRPPVLAGGVVVLIAAAGYFTFLAPPEIRDRVTEPTKGQERTREGRTTIWQVALRAAEDKPIAGVGAGNFRVASKHYIDEPGALARTDEITEKPAVAHNAYLEVLAELGVVGILLFVSILLTCLGSMIAAARMFDRKGDRRLQAVAIAVSIALIGVLVANFFFSDHYGKPMWLLLSLGPVLLTMARLTPPGSHART